MPNIAKMVFWLKCYLSFSSTYVCLCRFLFFYVNRSDEKRNPILLKKGHVVSLILKIIELNLINKYVYTSKYRFIKSTNGNIMRDITNEIKMFIRVD